MHGEDVVSRAAQVVRSQPHVALEQQAGADEQNHGERNFGAHEHFAHTDSRRARGGTARRLLQGCEQVLGAGSQQRDESGEQSANQHESRDGCDHNGVNADRLHAHHVPSRHDQPSKSRIGESQACCSSDGKKYERFDELLTNEPEATATERCPDGNFAPSRRGAGGQQIGDVEARDQQHAAGCSQ
jgi:hypothetical protein